MPNISYLCILLNILCWLALVPQHFSFPVPIPKYRSGVIGNVHSNSILFRDADTTGNILFQYKPIVKDRVAQAPLTTRQSYRRTFPSPIRTKQAWGTYEDKIHFSESVKNSDSDRQHYIRRISQVTSRYTPVPAQPISLPFRRITDRDDFSKRLNSAIISPESNTIEKIDIPRNNGEDPASMTRNTRTENNEDDVKESEKVDRVSLSWLQNWTSKHNYTLNDTSTMKIKSEDESSSSSNNITFLSLFRVPDVDKQANRIEQVPCGPNRRRNHHGICTRPIRIRFRIIEDENV